MEAKCEVYIKSEIEIVKQVSGIGLVPVASISPHKYFGIFHSNLILSYYLGSWRGI